MKGAGVLLDRPSIGRTNEAYRLFAGHAQIENSGGGTSNARLIATLGALCIEVGLVNATIRQVDECVRVDELQQLPEMCRQLIERLLD